MLHEVYSACSSFMEQQGKFVQALGMGRHGGNFSALNPIRAKQQNNMDYILTQTSMLKSETIVFNFIRVS